MSKKGAVIAIDGPAASGKGTLARRLAQHFGYVHLDTGKLYRAVGVLAMERGVALDEVSDLVEIAGLVSAEDVLRSDLYVENVGKAASVVAALPEVREALLAVQRRVAESDVGCVLDGRDIGTVVCPNADVKLFITASLKARAKRRYEELLMNGEQVDLDQVLAHLRVRDARDSGRSVAPLIQADDAYVIDTTDMDAGAVFECALEHISLRLS